MQRKPSSVPCETKSRAAGGLQNEAQAPNALSGQVIPPALAQPAHPPAADAAQAADADAAKATTLAVSVKPKRVAHNKGKGFISKRLKLAVEHVARGLTVTQAAEIAGMSRSNLSVALSRPHVVALLEQLVRASLAASAAKAAGRLDKLIDGARSEYVQLEASKAVLDRAGYAQSRTEQLGGDIIIEIKL